MSKWLKRLRQERRESAFSPPRDPSAQYGIQQFDSVRVLSSSETESLGYARKTGTCYGFTTPSMTGVDVIGDAGADLAFNVHFEDDEVEDAWFAPDLLQLVDHGPGTTISIGDKTFVRTADGEWIEESGGEPPAP